jgi:uncharacterized coiled-coil protein SlyX
MQQLTDIPIESRFETLEVRIAHLEDTVHKLSEELATQQQVLERQVDRYRQLLDQVRTEPSGASATQVEIPPHY